MYPGRDKSLGNINSPSTDRSLAWNNVAPSCWFCFLLNLEPDDSKGSQAKEEKYRVDMGEVISHED